jgi:hypothetical protein
MMEPVWESVHELRDVLVRVEPLAMGAADRVSHHRFKMYAVLVSARPPT